MSNIAKTARAASARPRADGEGSTIRVVATRTGLTMETLRAWERRYGFPRPIRRSGSNRRLYSTSEIERLLAIQRALGRGYRVGDVIEKSLEQLAALRDVTGPGAAEVEVRIGSGSAATVEQLVALLARDRVPELEELLRQSALTLGARRFVTELAHPFAVSVGRAWAGGELSIRHEHLATECLVTQLRQMLARYQEIEARPLVLLATLPGEPHTLPLQMVALYLVALGAKPRLLGGATPVREIVESANVLGADVVGLTVTAASDLAQARKDVRALQKRLGPEVPLWIGGGGAPALRVAGEATRIITTWDEVDGALARSRERPRRPSEKG